MVVVGVGGATNVNTRSRPCLLVLDHRSHAAPFGRLRLAHFSCNASVANGGKRVANLRSGSAVRQNLCSRRHANFRPGTIALRNGLSLPRAVRSCHHSGANARWSFQRCRCRHRGGQEKTLPRLISLGRVPPDRFQGGFGRTLCSCPLTHSRFAQGTARRQPRVSCRSQAVAAPPDAPRRARSDP